MSLWLLHRRDILFTIVLEDNLKAIVHNSYQVNKPHMEAGRAHYIHMVAKKVGHPSGSTAWPLLHALMGTHFSLPTIFSGSWIMLPCADDLNWLFSKCTTPAPEASGILAKSWIRSTVPIFWNGWRQSPTNHFKSPKSSHSNHLDSEKLRKTKPRAGNKILWSSKSSAWSTLILMEKWEEAIWVWEVGGKGVSKSETRDSSLGCE